MEKIFLLLENFSIGNYLDLIFKSLQCNKCMGKYLSNLEFVSFMSMYVHITILNNKINIILAHFFHMHTQDFHFPLMTLNNIYDTLLGVTPVFTNKSTLIFLCYMALAYSQYKFLLRLCSFLLIFMVSSVLSYCLSATLRQLLPANEDLPDSSQMQNLGCAKHHSFSFSPYFNSPMLF